MSTTAVTKGLRQHIPLLMSVLWAALSVVHPVLAQSPLSLADAVARAHAHNPDAEAAVAAEREAVERVARARAGYFPRVDIIESWQRGNQPAFVFSSLLAQRGVSMNDFAVAALNRPDTLDNFRSAVFVEQAVFDRSTAAHLRAAAIGREMAAVTEAFGRVLTATAMVRSAAALVETARAERELAVNRRDAGRVTDADVLQLEVYVARTLEQEVQAMSDERVARARLNQLMGEPLGTRFSLDLSASVDPIDISTPIALEQEAVTGRPEVALARQQERLAAATVDQARAAFISTHPILTGGAVAFLMGTALAGCTSPRAAAASVEPAAAIPVTVAPVAMTEVANVIDVGGVVQARTTATISARVLAPVREIRVSPGDHVRKGQTLVVLIGEELAAAARAARSAAMAAEQGTHAAAAELDAAEAGLALARASHERVTSLQVRRSATAQEFDDATAALRSAEARVTGASARVRQAQSAVESARATSAQATTTESFTKIAAPFDGIVTEKLLEPGNMASPGVPLLRLEDTGGFRLDVRVDESHVALIRRGDRVPVFLGSDTTSMTGTVDEVSRAVEAGAHAFLVKVALPDRPDLRSGAFGRARFAGTRRHALTIPPSSIVRQGQVTSVFVVDSDVARVRLVSVRDAEVLAGLVESEVVILAPPAGLRDGRRIRVGGL